MLALARSLTDNVEQEVKPLHQVIVEPPDGTASPSATALISDTTSPPRLTPPAWIPPAEIPQPIVSGLRKTTLQRWEGIVIEVDGDEFTATLTDLTDRTSPVESATFPIAEINDEDRSLIQPGGVFYWFVGYQIEPRGTKGRLSEIRFRRLPASERRRAARLESRADELTANWDS